jgi:hypothetical protein
MQFNERLQRERAEYIMQVLDQDGLSEWAYDFWHLTLQRLAKNETEFNYRYRKYNQEIIQNV